MSSRVTMPGAFGGDTRDGRDARDARDESLQDHGHHHAGPGASRPRSRSKSERSEDSGRDGRKDEGARDSGAESGREGARDGGRPPWSPSRGYPPPGQPASRVRSSEVHVTWTRMTMLGAHPMVRVGAVAEGGRSGVLAGVLCERVNEKE